MGHSIRMTQTKQIGGIYRNRLAMLGRKYRSLFSVVSKPPKRNIFFREYPTVPGEKTKQVKLNLESIIRVLIGGRLDVLCQQVVRDRVGVGCQDERSVLPTLEFWWRASPPQPCAHSADHGPALWERREHRGDGSACHLVGAMVRIRGGRHR